MKNLLLFLTLFAQVSLLADVIWVPFQDIAPTQMNIGVIAMQDKVLKIKKKQAKGKLHKYLLKKVAPAYLAKNGRYYIVDRHHTSRALYEARVGYERFPVEVVGDYTHLSMSDFFQRMEKEGNLYLSLLGSAPKDPSELPKQLWEISDDPYRSLAWMVREVGGFRKINYPYLEFVWANFLRARVPLQGTSMTALKEALPTALEKAKSDDAAHLPGYIDTESEVIEI